MARAYPTEPPTDSDTSQWVLVVICFDGFAYGLTIPWAMRETVETQSIVHITASKIKTNGLL